MIEFLSNLHKQLSNLEVKDLNKVCWALGISNFSKLALHTFDQNEETLFEFLINLGISESNKDLKTLIKQNGIKINNKLITNKESIDWIKIEKVELAVIKKGKNDFYLMFKEI